MKRIICAIFAAFALSGMLGACDKVGECETCGQREKLNKFVDKYDDVHWYCDQCYGMEKFMSY